MATRPVTVARIYLREGEHLLPKVLKLLHDEQQVSGVTVLRGIAGAGPDGRLHTSSFVDLSLDLPVIVEFYDAPERVQPMIDLLQRQLGLAHVVSWPAISHSQES